MPSFPSLPTDFPLNSGSLKKDVIPALVGAGICLFFQRSGLLTFFFLVPLGFLSLKFGRRAALIALGFTVLGNILFALGRIASVPGTEIIWDLVYFAAIASIFTWIMTPLPNINMSGRLSGGMRFILGSCLGALIFTGIFFRVIASPDFSGYMMSLLNTLVSAYRSSGSNVVEIALLDSLTPDVVLDLMRSVMLRGGSLISSVLLFFVCRQMSFALARIFLRNRRAGEERPVPLMLFHVREALIWVLSGSLLLVVLTRALKFEIPEIILWNILILCGILYFAQGLGILQFFTARPWFSPFLRLFLNVLFIVLIFSPGINVILLAGVILLGIAENWAPFRVSGSNGPPSTPEAGDKDV